MTFSLVWSKIVLVSSRIREISKTNKTRNEIFMDSLMLHSDAPSVMCMAKTCSNRPWHIVEAPDCPSLDLHLITHQQGHRWKKKSALNQRYSFWDHALYDVSLRTMSCLKSNITLYSLNYSQPLKLACPGKHCVTISPGIISAWMLINAQWTEIHWLPSIYRVAMLITISMVDPPEILIW